jgi:hypothetical protein
LTVLRIGASIRTGTGTGTVTASLIMRQFASYPRQNGVAAALRELGRLERIGFTLDWISDPGLRRTTGQELNKGEARNSLARAVFIHRLGEIRDRTYENQQHRASGLNFIVTAIILWNTRYLERAVAALRRIEDVPDRLLAHLSPLGWEHVNLTGDYLWEGQPECVRDRRRVQAASDPTRAVCQSSLTFAVCTKTRTRPPHPLVRANKRAPVIRLTVEQGAHVRISGGQLVLVVQCPPHRLAGQPGGLLGASVLIPAR